MDLLHNIKIRQKLTILLLFIGLVPTLVVSTIAYATISGQLNRKTEDQLASLSIKQAQKIDALLQSRQEQVLKLANRYDLQSALNSYLTSGAKDPRAITAVLRERKTEMTDVQIIYVSNNSEAIIAATVSGQEGQILDSRNYEAKAGQQNSITIRDDPRDGIQKLYVATKMVVNQKQIGALTLVFGLDDIVATLHDYTGLGTTGETLLARQDGPKQALSLFPPRFDESASVPLSSLQLPMHIDQTYSSVTDYRQHRVIVSTQSIASADWILATKIDQDEAFGPIRHLRNTLLFIVIASSVIISVIALFTTRLFTAPLIALTEKTHSIMLGNFKERIRVRSGDEIGTLAAAFNTMTNELEKSYRALEQKVIERTQALNQKVHELGDAKAKDDAILSSIGEGIIVTDSSGHVLLANQIAGDLLDTNTTSMLGKPLAINMLQANGTGILPRNEQPMETALRSGRKITRQVVIPWKDGQKRVLGITATPVLQRGTVIGSIQILRDITREKEVDRMKTEFISLASHQLRTPLSAIRWFSEMLLSGDAGTLTDQQTEFARNVYDSTERMIDLVGSLLNISRIESGRIRIDPVPTDVQELVNGIVRDLQAKLGERQQNIVVSVHKELPKINLDSRLISQVYLNLLTNAIKYSPKGSDIAVFVSRQGDQVISQVSDSGYGIPKAEQSKMFQRFFRASNVSKIETDGTGLGMYLVKAIIESSGGKIWFESEEGKGTTFWFSLPASGMKPKDGEVTID